MNGVVLNSIKSGSDNFTDLIDGPAMNKTPFDKICIEAVAFVISDRVDIIERYRRSFPHRPLKTSLSGIL